MPHPNSTTATIAMTLFGSFALGQNLARALHEFGHALGVWLGGAQVTRFVLHPFGASMVYYDFDRLTEKWPYLLYAWGGVVGGTVFSLAFLGSAYGARRGTTWWLIATMTATMGMALNGLYLVLGSIDPYGDAADLVYGLGFSRPFLFVVGVPLLVAFFYLFPRVVRGLGLKRQDGLRRWLLATEPGFLLYFVVMIVYAFSVSKQAPPSVFVVLGYLLGFATLCAVGTAIAFCFAAAESDPTVTSASEETSWPKAGILVGLGCLVIVGELLVF